MIFKCLLVDNIKNLAGIPPAVHARADVNGSKICVLGKRPTGMKFFRQV